MKYIWNDKLDNTANGNVEIIASDDKYNKFKIYMDKPCYVLVNHSVPFEAIGTLILDGDDMPEGHIYSVVLYDKNVNYYYEGVVD